MINVLNKRSSASSVGWMQQFIQLLEDEPLN